MTISPATLVAALSSASVILYSNNDTRFSNDVLCGGCTFILTVRAGRSILIDPGVSLDLGDRLYATYNDGGVTTSQDAGTATFTMGVGFGADGNSPFDHPGYLQWLERRGRASLQRHFH